MFASIGTLYVVKTYDRDGSRDHARQRAVGATAVQPVSDGGLSRTTIDPTSR